MEQSRRPIRLLLNAQLIRRVDEVIATGTGGFTSREELVEEALNSYLLELRDIEHVSQDPAPKQAHVAVAVREAVGLGPVQDRAGRVPTTISSPTPGFAAEGDEIFLVEAPMLGLHNRDWPSLWALGRLANAAVTDPVSFPGYLETVTGEAWQLVAALQEELGANAKAVTRMLPTNPLKKQSAEAGFQNFAIGSLSSKPSHEGLHRAAGPLPAWRAIAFFKGEGEFRVALTEQGWELLEITDGLGPEQPHNPRAAKTFFAYLQTNSPSDWWGFETVLRAVSKAPTRDALLASMGAAREWSPSVASSVAQGYIARCREWGLIEPKLVDGTYRLTEFGKEILHNA